MDSCSHILSKLQNDSRYLLLAGRKQQVILRVRQAAHHALHPVLAAARQHAEKVDAERARLSSNDGLLLYPGSRGRSFNSRRDNDAIQLNSANSL